MTKFTQILFCTLAMACNHTAEGVQADAKNAELAASKAVDNSTAQVTARSAQASANFEQFKRESREELGRVQDKLAVMRERAATSAGEARAETEHQAEALEQKRAVLAGRIEAFQQDAENKWESGKVAVKEDIASLGRDTDTALDRLGNSVRRATQVKK
jgi:hypothetical protein